MNKKQILKKYTGKGGPQKRDLSKLNITPKMREIIDGAPLKKNIPPSLRKTMPLPPKVNVPPLRDSISLPKTKPQGGWKKVLDPDDEYKREIRRQINSKIRLM